MSPRDRDGPGSVAPSGPGATASVALRDVGGLRGLDPSGATEAGPARADRRASLRGAIACALAATPVAALGAPPTDRFAWAPVTRGPMRFPEDFGAHPDHRTEWWYVTGWLSRPEGPDFGIQLTFFRTRTAHPAANPSRFAPTQLVLAHAALALPERGRLLHAERAARAGTGLADAATGDTRVWSGRGADAWSLERDPATDRYRARIATADFDFELRLDPGGPPLLQGDAGYSRKGPAPGQASRYYSRPQLGVEGRLRVGRDAPVAVRGTAWFDHEWSSETMGADSVGWDWIGLNLDDGGALMAFRMRGRDGGVTWSDATVRAGRDGAPRTGLRPTFEPIRHWTSPRTGARWPVAMRVRVADRELELRPLIDDQELDARGSTGTTYWEGAVTAFEAGRRVGRGYLELTGYAGALRL